VLAGDLIGTNFPPKVKQCLHNISEASTDEVPKRT